MTDMLTTSQVADMFGISAATVRQTILRGSIKAQKIEKVWYIEHDEAERFWGKKAQDEEDTKIALDLLYSLRDGNTDLLFEMFPDLEKELGAPQPKTPPDDPDLKKKVDFHDQVIQTIIANGLQAPAKETSTNYHMSSPRPPEVTSTAPAFSGTKPISTTNGKSDGSAADNLLDSLNNF